ncbi:MAG TPA: cytochrome c maturation protein CcmE [Caulobacteraceae bacterium]|jgi:cytochrome c-type biogenesis protein CcmE
MAFLPKSRTARRRLMTFAVAAPVLALAAGVALYAMRGSISYFYTPAQAAAAHVPAGHTIELGGLVKSGSLVRKTDGEVSFVIVDKLAASPVSYKGELPDLFREGQGVVARGAYLADGTFVADQVLAKHDEKYMPPQVAQALKKEGEWRRGDPQAPPQATATAAMP